MSRPFFNMLIIYLLCRFGGCCIKGQRSQERKNANKSLYIEKKCIFAAQNQPL